MTVGANSPVPQVFGTSQSPHQLGSVAGLFVPLVTGMVFGNATATASFGDLPLPISSITANARPIMLPGIDVAPIEARGILSSTT